jgi:ribonuclease P protein component
VAWGIGDESTGRLEAPVSGTFRFRPDVRLRSRREFLAVQDRGRRISARYLTMLALPNTLHRNRLGIVASRRIGGAVVRNRVKRRLRELFRHLDPDRPAHPSAAARPGFDLVVIARRDAAEAPFLELSADFKAALGRAGVRPRS